MRIITGSARGIVLDTPNGEEITRPTADRVKEALFSMLRFDVEGRKVLDLFAGSGQLGLEALSRGAAKAVFIDISRESVDVILKNAAKTKLRNRCVVSSSDFKAFLNSAVGREKYDVIFLDPPYSSNCMKEALSIIQSGNLLATNGVIVCESDTSDDEKKKNKRQRPSDADAVLNDVFSGDTHLMEKFTVRRTARYGRTRLTLLEI